MVLEVTASEVHNKETFDDRVWIVIRRGVWEAIGSEMLIVLTEDAFDEGGPAEFCNDWGLEKVRDSIQQALRAHYPVNCLRV